MSQAYNKNVSEFCNKIKTHAEAIVKYHDARKITKKGVEVDIPKMPVKKRDISKGASDLEDSEEMRIRKDQELAEMFLIEEEARMKAEILRAAEDPNA